MTSAERFTRIEENLLATTEALKISVQVHIRTEEALAVTSRVVAEYVEASNVRMKQMEENLEALIRAITAEHGNGKPR